jgi:hypothetical protein
MNMMDQQCIPWNNFTYMLACFLSAKVSIHKASSFTHEAPALLARQSGPVE